MHRFPWHCLLLPVFFVLHRYVQQYGLLPAGEALAFGAAYTGAALLALLLLRAVFRDTQQAGLFCLALLFFELFFGPAQDRLAQWLPRWGATLLLLAALGTLLFLIWRRGRRGKLPAALTSYLNLLLLVLLLVDAAGWVRHRVRHAAEKKERALPLAAVAGPKPDVYLIVADEYAGSRALRELFGFDNRAFLDSLRRLGFQVEDDARSNYNYTEYSVASLLNASYFPSAVRTNPIDVGRCYAWIRDNEVSLFFQAQGYELHNLSVFDFDGRPSVAPRTWNDQWEGRLYPQTFTARMQRSLGRKPPKLLSYDAVNSQLVRATGALLAQTPGKPRFVYTHLLLPHSPYYRDRNGQPLPAQAAHDEYNRDAYLEYLQYGNGIYLSLVQRILGQARRPTVILLLGDHGFRGMRPPVRQDYAFMTLAAVYTSPGLLKEWPAGKGTVNTFRILLDSCFGQKLPLLPAEQHFIGTEAP